MEDTSLNGFMLYGYNFKGHHSNMELVFAPLVIRYFLEGLVGWLVGWFGV